MPNRLAESFHRAVDFSRRRNQRYGTVGKLLETGQVIYEAGDSTVWVMLDDGTVIEAFNNKVQRARIDVIVEPGKGGIWRIIDVQEDKTRARYGAKAAVVAAPPVSGDLAKDPVDSRRITYGLVYATGDGFNAIIREFEYRCNGRDVVFPSTAIQLENFVPIAGLQRWVKVGVDPATNIHVIVAGDTFGIQVPTGRAQLALIDFATPGYEPLAGALLKGGQTQLFEDAFVDARLWLGAGGRISGFDSILTDSDGNVLSDSNGNVLHAG